MRSSVLYAYTKVNDTTETVTGKLNIISLDKQNKKVYLVPVNGPKEMPSPTKLQDTLDVMYAQAATHWVVEQLPGIRVDFPGGNMTHGGSNDISVYNADQKKVIKAFKKQYTMENDALYLFFVDGVTRKSGDIAGYMPLQRQAGFIYGDPSMTLVAHELGHGAFNLRHTFSPEKFVAAQGSTRNLMDYKDGRELWQHQWRLVQDPENLWLAFLEGEEEGEMPCLGLLDDCRKVQNILDEVRNARLKKETVILKGGENKVLSAYGLNINGTTYNCIRLIYLDDQDVTINPLSYSSYKMTHMDGDGNHDVQKGYVHLVGGKEVFKIIIDDESNPFLPLEEYVYGNIERIDAQKYLEYIRNAYIAKQSKLKITSSTYMSGLTAHLIGVVIDNRSEPGEIEFEIPSQRPKATDCDAYDGCRQFILKGTNGSTLTIRFGADKQNEMNKFLFPEPEGSYLAKLEGDGSLTREEANEIRDEYIEKITDPEKKAEAYFMFQAKVPLIDPEHFKGFTAVECYDAADTLLRRHSEETGKPYNTTSPWALATQDETDIYLHLDCYRKALLHLDEELGKGNPVMVGVDWRKGQINFDKITDHWVVITARRHDEKGIYYTYIEVAEREKTGSEQDGPSASFDRGVSTTLNRFYFDETNTYLIGANPTVNEKGDQPIVTVIRGYTTDPCCSRREYEAVIPKPMENANRKDKNDATGELLKIRTKNDYKKK